MSESANEGRDSEPEPPSPLNKKRSQHRVERVVTRILAKRQASTRDATVRRAKGDASDGDYRWF